MSTHFANGVPKPMLALKYTGWPEGAAYVLVSPKLDGMRCIATKDGLWTRTGKRIYSASHIEKSLEHFFEQYPHVVIDGELYSHSLRDDFPRLMSLARKQKPTKEELKESPLLQYHVFDSMGPSRFEERFGWLAAALPVYGWKADRIQLVKTTVVYADQVEEPGAANKEITSILQSYLEQGYEGLMVRVPGFPYEYDKRSKSLLKYKVFSDAELTVVDILPGKGNWEGIAKHVVLRLENGSECGAGIKGTKEFLTQVLKDKDLYIGGDATVRFFSRTDDALRFPVVSFLWGQKRDG